MRLITLIFLSILSINAQPNDQAMMVRISPLNPFVLDISSAIILNEHEPLRIESATNINNGNILILLVLENPEHPVIIEVLHPSILERFTRLNHLQLWNVGMRRIGENSFRNCSISSATLSSNLLQEIPAGVFRKCGFMSQLVISSNQITKITPESFIGLRSLQSLDLTNNFISSINSEFFTYLPLIGSLFISQNPIIELMPAILPHQLMFLDISDCGISQLHPDSFKNLTDLLMLTLDHNPISELPQGVFSDLTSLISISLDHTNIRRLNLNSFSLNSSLESFWISNSAFDELQHGFFENFPYLNRFDTRNNPCADVALIDVRFIDFTEDPVLHECFANWFVSRTTTTTEEPMQDSGGDSLILNGLILMIGFVKLILCKI